MKMSLCHFPRPVDVVFAGQEVGGEFLRDLVVADSPVTEHAVQRGPARLTVVLPGVRLEPPAVTELDLAGLTAENKNLRRPNPDWPPCSRPHPLVSGSRGSGGFLVLPSRGGAGRAIQLQHGGLRGADLDDGVAHRALPPQLGPSLCGAGRPECFPAAGLEMTLEVFTVTAEPAPSTAELLFGTVGVSGQVCEGLEAEGAGLAEILECSEVFPLSMSTGEFEL